MSRRNGRGGRSAAENFIGALRCLYRQAEDDGLIDKKDNPASKVEKPRRLPSTRRAIADTRLAQINQVAATTGDDPELDALILRLHTETACRRGGALALRPLDLDPEQCLVCLREKGETVRWQPVKGAPPARRARAEPAQRDRELKTRSAGEECVRSASVTTWSSAGNGGGRFAPVASAEPRPLARGR